MALSTINLTPGMRANLISLQNTSKYLEITQKRLATGLKVNSALDDPINFFAAKAHNLRASDLSARKDGMSEAIQTIKAANVGIETITDLIAQAKSVAQAAISATDPTVFQQQYDDIMIQIDEVAKDSGYAGVNLLQNGVLTVEFAPTAGESTITVNGFGGDPVVPAEFTPIATARDTSGWPDAAEIQLSIDELDSVTATLRDESQRLSNNLSIITAREEFTSEMINTLQDGAAKLTEADMNEEGANMLMLQTRQALGTTSLSLASQAAQSVLRLF
jgi:flagellin-like hook-associated protein FlgL